MHFFSIFYIIEKHKKSPLTLLKNDSQTKETIFSITNSISALCQLPLIYLNAFLYAITSQTRACVYVLKIPFRFILSPHTTLNAVHGNFKYFFFSYNASLMNANSKIISSLKLGRGEEYEGLKKYKALSSRTLH